MATTDHVSCNAGNPFMQLGDGTSAPILNYNLPQRTCFHSNGYYPILIPENYFDSAYQDAPATSSWSIAEGMSLEQITASLRRDAMGSAAPVLLQNAQLLRRRNGTIRFISDEGIKYVATNVQAETYVVGDSNLRVSRLGSEGSGGSGQRTSPSNGMHTGRINHLSALPTFPPDKIQIAGYTLEFLASQVADGLIPEVYMEFGGKICIRFLPKPAAKPAITLVEHYKTCSFLGDYGAGKTVRTFSLLPGENTTITVKSYKDKTSSYVKSSSTNSNEYSSTYYADDETSTAVRSENILDSFSQHSADQMQSYLESQYSDTQGSQTQVGGSLQTGSGGGVQGGVNLLGLVHFQTGSGNQTSTAINTLSNQIRETNMSQLSGAMEASVNESNVHRDLEVNTTTGNTVNSNTGGNSGFSTSISVSEQESMMVRAGEEALTVRQIRNINHSRTLNFVFRQMLQEYLVITHLHDVTVVFSNGFASERIVTKLSGIEDLIARVIPDPDNQLEVRKAILLQLCNVINHEGTSMAFAEEATENWSDCVDATEPATFSYWRKKAGLSDSYSSGGLEITVPGIITSVNQFILRTDSVIVDSILGQGEALDCYNMRLQDEAAKAAELKNTRYEQETSQEQDKVTAALAVIDAITDPVEKAEAWRKIFGDCCLEDVITNLNLGTPS